MTILYHYTNGAGLKGILESKSLWASDCRFLNDASEFNHGWSILQSEIQKKETEIRIAAGESWRFLDSLRIVSENSKIVALVASLSTEGDLLSQWRGYNGGRGYAIGFNDEWLNQNAEKQGFTLFPVVYEKETQRKSAQSAIELLLGKLSEAKGDPSGVYDAIVGWWEHALRVALTFKNEHFSEERELRLAHIGQFWPSGIQVRPGPAGIVPYLPCQFNILNNDNPIFDPRNFGVERIIIGPALREQQLASVDALLASQGMRVELVRSDIPYVAD